MYTEPIVTYLEEHVAQDGYVEGAADPALTRLRGDPGPSDPDTDRPRYRHRSACAIRRSPHERTRGVAA